MPPSVWGLPWSFYLKFYHPASLKHFLFPSPSLFFSGGLLTIYPSLYFICIFCYCLVLSTKMWGPGEQGYFPILVTAVITCKNGACHIKSWTHLRVRPSWEKSAGLWGLLKQGVISLIHPKAFDVPSPEQEDCSPGEALRITRGWNCPSFPNFCHGSSQKTLNYKELVLPYTWGI